MEIQKNEAVISKTPFLGRNFWLVIFIFLPVLYCVLYAPYGYCDTDQGFIQSLSWRILNGEVMYSDFDYVRPPVTPYHHAAAMWVIPDSWEVLGLRCFAYLDAWLLVLFGVLILKKYFDFSQSGISPWLMGVVAYVFEIHNAPPMPWHTLDGMLLAIVGLFFITRDQGWAVLIGSGALLLSALCKQSFYLIPLGAIPVVYIIHRWKGLFLFALGNAVVVLTVFLLPGSLLQNFFHQSSGAGVKEFFDSAVMAYAKISTLVVALAWLKVFILKRFFSMNFIPWMVLFFIVFVEGMFALHIFTALKTQAYLPPSFGFYQGIFLFALFALAVLWFSGNLNGKCNLIAVSSFMLFETWTSSLSWGYQIPSHNLLAVIFPVTLFIYVVIPEFTNRILVFLATTSLACFFILYQYPYRDAPRAEMTFHLGELSPKLNGIYCGNSMYYKTQELFQYSDYGKKPFAVFPAFPQADYLLNRKPVFRTDWEHNGEIGDYHSNFDSVLSAVPEVWIQKDHLAELEKVGIYGSEITKYVRSHWRKAGESRWFEFWVKG